MWSRISFVVALTCVLVPLWTGSLLAGPIEFQDVTREAGLYEPLLGIMGHGGAVGDVDGDGDIDLFVGGFADRRNDEYSPAPGPVGNRLLENLGGGKFRRVEKTPLEFFARTSGAVFADLDNDGSLDLYVANNCKGKTGYQSGPQREAQLRYSNLFRNDAGRFVDVSNASGACPKSLGTARNIGVFDYDGDGLLDLLVLEDRFTRNPRSALFRNQGKLRFKDVTQQVGLPEDVFGLGLAVADLNGDLRPDFFVAHSNRLFFSTKDGRYKESQAARETFAWEPLDNEDWPCGAAFGDLNGDGRLDLVIGIHHERARNQVFLNTGVKGGEPRFRNVTAEAGIEAGLPNKSPHVEIQDFDLDGRPDIYFSTAWLEADGSLTPLVYRNLGVKNGVPMFEANRAIKPVDNIVYFPAGPSVDYDNDGRLDLLLINWFRGNHTRLMRNVSGADNHYVKVTVVGQSFNRMGIGSQVKVYAAGKAGQGKSLLGVQELTTGYGYASGQEAACYFGVADAERVDIEVRLPNGKTALQSNVPVDRSYTIVESE